VFVLCCVVLCCVVLCALPRCGRYYKGLGTSTAEEGKEYFSNLPVHRRNFAWAGEEDAAAITMAFDREKVCCVGRALAYPLHCFWPPLGCSVLPLSFR
jgi:hypothetical protein